MHLISAPDRGVVNLKLWLIYPGGRAPYTHWIASPAGPRAEWASWSREKSLPLPGSKPRHPSHSQFGPNSPSHFFLLCYDKQPHVVLYSQHVRWLCVSTSWCYSWRHSSQKYHKNIDSILNDYEAIGISPALKMIWETESTTTHVRPASQGSHMFASDGVPECEIPWPMDWYWWSVELATMVTGPQSP